MKTCQLLGAALAAGFVASSAMAQNLYSEDFEVDPTANWTVNNGPSDEAHDFFFDYSTVGIGAAPNSSGGTHGMQLQANLFSGTFSGMSASPTGESFGGSYTVSFDWWANFNGPFPAGGSGSTNLSTFGVGTAGASAQWPGGAIDSVYFGATGDGGSASDYRAYSSAAPTSYSSGNAVYAAPGGAINHSDPYYALLGGNPAPAAQTLLFPQQAGVTNAGSAGMEWHEVEITVDGGDIIWTVDGLLIATIDQSTVTLGGGNILFGHSDINSGSSTDPNAPDLLFTLIDNISVDVVPEPGSIALMGLGGLALLRRRRA